MRMIAMVGALVALGASPAIAEEQSGFSRVPFTKENLSPVRIHLEDEATGGCWTNLNETSSYADAQMKLGGFSIADDNETSARTVMIVQVNAYRTNSVCFGGYSINIKGYANWEDEPAYVALLQFSGYFSHQQNANTVILDAVKNFRLAIEELPAS